MWPHGEILFSNEKEHGHMLQNERTLKTPRQGKEKTNGHTACDPSVPPRQISTGRKHA